MPYGQRIAFFEIPKGIPLWAEGLPKKVERRMSVNMHKLLEEFISRYFKNKLMPGIRENAKAMEEHYGASGARELEPEKDYRISSFGFQTEFMMRYMLLAFGAVSVILLLITAGVNSGALQGAAIFGAFFVLCLFLWAICRVRRGFIVYSKDWIWLEKGKIRKEFSMKNVKALKVLGNLTLVFSRDGGDDEAVRVPLEGGAYVEFARFIEKNYPSLKASIPDAAWKKAMKRHGSSWGNQM